MRRKLIVRIGFLAVCGLGLGSSRAQAPAQEKAAYCSPYRVEFRAPVSELIADLERTERGNPRLESETPHDEWYTHHARTHFGSWGPHPRAYPPPAGVESWPIEMQRERVIAVALRFLGYAYQHHHIPDWNPPASWPWKHSCAGHNGRGVDCSNFTGFIYNLGFGLRLNTDVHHQAEERFAIGPGRGRTPVRHIALPESYADRLATLRTGDLIFIRSNRGNISHVVIWVGDIGRSPDGTPLIIDSHGEDVRDSNDQPIPCGIHLRPFRERSWYNHSADHAIRIISGD
jgi:hypothetical protein